MTSVRALLCGRDFNEQTEEGVRADIDQVMVEKQPAQCDKIRGYE